MARFRLKNYRLNELLSKKSIILSEIEYVGKKGFI